jgi:hypothetical protein
MAALIVITHGPHIPARKIYGLQIIAACSRVRAVDDGPGRPIPVLDESLHRVSLTRISHRPYIILDTRSDTVQLTTVCAEIRTSDNSPRLAIPMLHEGLVNKVIIDVIADCPYVRKKLHGYALQIATIATVIRAWHNGP